MINCHSRYSAFYRVKNRLRFTTTLLLQLMRMLSLFYNEIYHKWNEIFLNNVSLLSVFLLALFSLCLCRSPSPLPPPPPPLALLVVCSVVAVLKWSGWPYFFAFSSYLIRLELKHFGAQWPSHFRLIASASTEKTISYEHKNRSK